MGCGCGCRRQRLARRRLRGIRWRRNVQKLRGRLIALRLAADGAGAAGCKRFGIVALVEVASEVSAA